MRKRIDGEVTLTPGFETRRKTTRRRVPAARFETVPLRWAIDV
jgi:hypothetical protein